jgi:amino acid permease
MLKRGKLIIFLSNNIGTWGSATAIFMSNLFGIGMFSLPYAFSQSGLILGLFFLVFGVILGVWSNRCIVACAYKQDKTKFSELVSSTLGKVV